MTKLSAHLQNGRLVLDEDLAPPSDRPPLHLGLDDEGDDLDEEEIDLDEEELNRLEAVIEESIAQIARGEWSTADDVMARLRLVRTPRLGLKDEGLLELEAMIEESIQQLDRGEGIDANEALAQMWALFK